MPPDTTPIGGSPEQDRVDELRSQLVSARSRTRQSLVALESEVRGEIVAVTHFPSVFAAHRACFLGAAVLLGFLYGNRR